MPRSLFSENAAAALQRAVAYQRRTGLKNEHAIEAVADLFDMSPRRVKSWLYGEIINPTLREIRLIIRRWETARELEVTRLSALSEQLRLEIERERVALAQLELPLGSSNDQRAQKMDRVHADALGRASCQLDAAARAEARYRALQRGALK